MLAVHTEEGEKFDREGKGVLERYCEKQKSLSDSSIWSRFAYAETPADCPFDFVIMKEGLVVAIAECKSRCMDSERLFGQYNGEWLLSLSKFEGLRRSAEVLRVPAYGLLYMRNDRVLLRTKICGPDGYACRMRVETTKTRATCNGGEKEVANCFICMDGATVIEL